MGPFRRAWVLAAVLMLNIVLAVLLTPLGFESRPTAALRPAGYLAIGAVFAGLALDLAALALIFLGRIGWACRLAIAGSVLFLFPNVVDQTGVFFSVHPPGGEDARVHVHRLPACDVGPCLDDPA